MNRLLIVIVSIVCFSCAHQKPTSAEAPPAAPAEDNSPVVTPAEVPWKEMTKEQKGRYMKKVVLPKATELLQAFDPKEFAEVKCATCHGKNAKENEFKMPSKDLPKLPASHKEFMATTMKEHPEIVKFMGEKFTPTVANLLGLKPFDPKNPDPNAFSCGRCHQFEGKPDHQ
jgi:cytochrome c553